MTSTRSGEVYQAVRRMLLNLEIPPGQKVPIAELCAQFDVSLGVVREALTRMVGEGLLIAEAQRGFRVPSLSLADLRDLTFARVQIESICLRLSIEHGDVEWEGSVVAAHHVLRTSIDADRAGDDGDIMDRRSRAHAQFHEALVSACRSGQLLNIRRSLFDASELYRIWSFARSPRRRDTRGEHEAIMLATIQRRADDAVQLLCDHIVETSQALIDASVEEPAAMEAV